MARGKNSKSEYETLEQDIITAETNTYQDINLGLCDSGIKDPREPIEQYPPPVGSVDTRCHHVFRSWHWEIWSLLVALGLMVVTYCILSWYNGQRVPEWSFSINLNTLIALISTIIRAMMLVSVAEIISQTKWDWFSRSRPLSHMKNFDEASRSISGSLGLLFVAPGSILGVLGALITILSVGIGPFTQQAIKTIPCIQTHRELEASLPLAHFAPGMGTYSQIAGTTWDSRYYQVTADNYSLPNGMWVNTDDNAQYPNIRPDYPHWAKSAFTPEFLAGSLSSITNVTVLSVTMATQSKDERVFTHPDSERDSQGGQGGPVAALCSVYVCLKNYNASIEKGILSENIVSTEPAPLNWVEYGRAPRFIDPSGVPRLNYTALQRPCLVDGQWFDISNMSSAPKTPNRTFTPITVEGTNYTVPNDCLYKMGWIYASALQIFMEQDLFNGNCTFRESLGQSISCNSRWWLVSLYNDKKASFETLSTAFDQFATAVTNKLRTSGSSIYDWNIHETVQGTVEEVTMCTQFQWQWLLMPTILIAATTAILVATILQNVRNREQPVWKSSLLPLLYYGFAQRIDPSKPVMGLSELNQAAANAKAVFRNGAEAGFVGAYPISENVERQKRRNMDVDSLLEEK
ncbi:hypothetical protein M426DRAFT_266618 [Hypoxylon sp. CI-4A]|nr:hypothetical protein M426DRAFT_266618 [Hypoxylon sp. CI-4A]